jgi:hypothetical protein
VNDSVNELFPGNDAGERHDTFHINEDSFSQIKSDISPSDPMKAPTRGNNAKAMGGGKKKGTFGDDYLEDMMI